MSDRRRVITEKSDRFMILELYVPGCDLSSFEGLPFADDFIMPDNMLIAGKAPTDGMMDISHIIGHATIIRRGNKYFAEKLYTFINPTMRLITEEVLSRIYERRLHLNISGTGNFNNGETIVRGFKPNHLYVSI